MRVDFDYLMKQVKAGKVKRPWRKMSRRQFKKHCQLNFDYDDLFILATNAKVGDIYYEHEENHRISEICRDDPAWHPMWMDGTKIDRWARKAKILVAGYIVNELGQSVCGCGCLSLPVSLEKAAELELMNCLLYYDYERLRQLQKKYGWYESEKKLLKDWQLHDEARNDPGFALYVDWAKRTVRIYDEQGPLTIVDEDGVLLQSYRETRSDIWKMCWSTKEQE